jgi:hypothetical protein
MNDTEPIIAKILKEKYNLLTPGERLKKCFGMYETAKALVLSSISDSLKADERRKIFFKRMHGYSLPEKMNAIEEIVTRDR